MLVVEEETAMAVMLTSACSFARYESVVAPTAFDALNLLESEAFDAVLLDLDLSGLNGRALLEHLRMRSPGPILALSCEAGEQDVVGALDLGADDFVAKPFSVGELLARIRAAFRRYYPNGLSTPNWDRRTAALISPALPDPSSPDARGSVEPASAVSAGPIILDEKRLTATACGRSIELTWREHQVLHSLLVHGPFVTRAQLLEAVFGSKPVHKNNVRVQVHRLRHKLRMLCGREVLRTRGRSGWELMAPADGVPTHGEGGTA
jgi:DNA-binding response OmpR family regulator